MIKILSSLYSKRLPWCHMSAFCTQKYTNPSDKIFIYKKPKLTSQERLKLAEQMDRQINIDVLRRELLNDTIQLPLKYFAYYTAPLANKSTFFAELIRSCIDAINHCVLFGTSYLNLSISILFFLLKLLRGPTRHYPYGIEKLKNMVVLIPAFLFLYFGLEIQYESLCKVFYGQLLEQDSHGSLTSLILYLASISIEIGIISKNIQSANKVDNAEGNQVKRTFFGKIKSIFGLKDPVLQAILFENAITLSSTLVPIVSSVLTIVHPSPLYEIVGSLIIGGIQINLGYHLMYKNVKKLMGEEALDKASVIKITNIIKTNPFVQDVSNQKAVMIGSRTFRFAAEITFDTKKISKEIFDDYYEKMERVIYTDSYSDRESYLRELIHEVPKKLLAKLHQEIESISFAIKDEFPNCLHDELEINQKQMAEIYNEEEGENNLFTMTQEDEKEIPFEKWMLEEADQIISYFLLKDKSDKNKIYIDPDEYCRSIQHSTFEDTEDYEDLVLFEDYKFSELQSEIKNDKGNIE